MLFQLLLSLLMLFPSSSDNVQLTIQVENVQHAKGALMIGVFDNSKDFPLGDIFEGKKVPVSSKQNAKLTINLPKGDYALVVYHDVNGNEELDKNFIGYPTEPLGFSNAAWNPIGPPSFRKAKVTLSDSSNSVVLRLR